MRYICAKGTFYRSFNSADFEKKNEMKLNTLNEIEQNFPLQLTLFRPTPTS